MTEVADKTKTEDGTSKEEDRLKTEGNGAGGDKTTNTARSEAFAGGPTFERLGARDNTVNESPTFVGLIDFDGTLFETESFYDDVMDQLFHDCGITDRKRLSYKDVVADKYKFVTGTGWRIIIPGTVEYLTGKRPTAEETESLVNEFTKLVCDRVEKTGRDHLYGVTRGFCKGVIMMGGRVSIHSGTEPEIVHAFLKTQGMEDMFDGLVSSNKVGAIDGGYTRYKKMLISRLMNEYPQVDKSRFFVLGDSNGDGFAAKELDLCYVMARTNDGPRDLTVGDETIHPKMTLIVDGDDAYADESGKLDELIRTLGGDAMKETSSRRTTGLSDEIYNL